MIETNSDSHRALPPFAPVSWLKSGDRQTLAGVYLFTGRRPQVGERRLIKLPDGDQLLISDAAPSGWRHGHRIAVLFHGLGGTFLSPYVLRVGAKLRDRGVRTVCVNMRGCGEGLAYAKGPGHAGRSEDAAAVAKHVRQRYPDSPVTLLGFSMGGNIVLKLAAEHDMAEWNIDSCWAAGPPIDIRRCADNLRDRKLYSKSFVRALWKHLHRGRKHHASIREMRFGARPKTIDEFDDRFTAPLSGFDGVDDYYSRASSWPLLRNIKTPTQIIAAADDPIIPVEIFQDVELSPWTQLHLTEGGGHIGYVAKQGVDPDRRWLDWRAIDWVMLHGLQQAPSRTQLSLSLHQTVAPRQPR